MHYSSKAIKYSEELMAKILEFRRKDYTIEQIAIELNVSPSSIQKWIMWGRGGATAEDRVHRGHRGPKRKERCAYCGR